MSCIPSEILSYFIPLLRHTEPKEPVMTSAPSYASPVDTAVHGEYRYVRPEGDDRPLYRFSGRITADATSEFPAEAVRYHLYAGWFCPWSQRSTIQRLLNGLGEVVSVSYVDNRRDGRGWAFRETNGPDPVNGFTLLRAAFDATEPDFVGHVSVPVLWDRVSNRIVSNDYATIEVDLATQFTAWGTDAATYPVALQSEIEELDRWLGPALNHGVAVAAGSTPQAAAARVRLLETFSELDARLAQQPYLLGDSVTVADVRAWVSLVRFDAEANATRTISPGLPEYPHLWAYARNLYAQPAFRDSTDFATFTVADAIIPDWVARDVA
jgi:putative glutathione S-transferase